MFQPLVCPGYYIFPTFYANLTNLPISTSLPLLSNAEILAQQLRAVLVTLFPTDIISYQQFVIQNIFYVLRRSSSKNFTKVFTFLKPFDVVPEQYQKHNWLNFKLYDVFVLNPLNVLHFRPQRESS